MTLAALPINGTFAGCPHCKGRRLRMHFANHLFRIVCLTRDCEAQGPRDYDESLALAKWNGDRPLLPRSEHLSIPAAAASCRIARRDTLEEE